MLCRIFALVVLLVHPLNAQSTAAPGFEAASLRLSPSETRPLSYSSNPGRWSCLNCPLMTILTHVFFSAVYQIQAPEWANTVKYDLIARLPEGSKREDVRFMLQNLLAERLKMKTHPENVPRC